MKLESAAVIVPYNPLLKGEVEPSQYLEKVINFLKCTGFELRKISIMKESDRSVACELNLFVKLYDVVIILWNAKAQCVNGALANITEQELVNFIDLESYFDNSSTTRWPLSSKLLKSSNICPIIYLQRIFIVNMDLIGEQFNLILKDHLMHYQNETLYSKNFYVTLNGSKKYIESFKNENLSISFAKVNVNQIKQDVLTLAATDFESIVNGEIFLRSKLGSDILSSSTVITNDELIYRSEDRHIQFSIEVIEKCLEDYGIDNIFLSFNGGKDCTVLLHLLQTVLHRKYSNDIGKNKLFCLYVRSDNAFKEQDEFIEQCMMFYNLEIMSVTGNIKDALQITINRKPYLKACFMGTRRTDPYCSHLDVFQMTDSDWPPVMRCSPFLDWHYSDIWDYLLYYKVPYCKIYDFGYTSLGNASNTIRNPSLVFCDGDKEVYLPAYKMLNEKKERSGRNVSKM